jgi:hypothetical protein
MMPDASLYLDMSRNLVLNGYFGSNVINDEDDPQRWNKYLGEKELIPLLREKGIANTDICGESLWYQPQKMVHPGCVFYYYRALNSTKKFSVRVVRELCFPTKEPFNDKGTWFSQSLKTYADYRDRNALKISSDLNLE